MFQTKEFDVTSGCSIGSFDFPILDEPHVTYDMDGERPRFDLGAVHVHPACSLTGDPEVAMSGADTPEFGVLYDESSSTVTLEYPSNDILAWNLKKTT